MCFATILKDTDKFSEKSEKCVLVGYASGKKAYKLLSLENRSILYSRDVKFYETVFPFKHSSEKENYEFHFQNTNGKKNLTLALDHHMIPMMIRERKNL